jgi:putative ABC transport system permease protein
MFTDLKLRLRSLFRRDAVERELDAELAFHLAQLTASFEREGMTHDEAARRARLELGGVDQIKEAHRDARGIRGLADLGRDARYAVRQVRRAPAFAALAMLCLGLGIGVNVAIFSVINAVVLRPLPVIDADRLIRVTRGDQPVQTYAGYLQLRDATRVLSGATVSFPMESDIDLNGESEFVVAEAVPANYSDVIGVAPLLGRWPTHEAEPSAVISHAIWERRFNRDPAVLGRLIRSESQTYTVVGVAPREFGGVFGPMRTDLWVPVRTRPRLAAMIDERKTTRMMLLFGRLRDGATAAEAATELNLIDVRLEGGVGRSSNPRVPLVAEVVRGLASGGPEVPRITTLLAGVVGLVLLIACVNVGNLLLVRGALRQREFAVRRALGATRGRLVRQLLVESLVLSIGGGLCGVVLALWTTRLLERSFPAIVSAYAVQIGLALDWRAVAFATLVSLGTTVLCGWLPAWRASRAIGLVGFKQEIGTALPRRRPLGLIAQVVMSLVLLFIAGSFLQALVRMQTIDPGFAVDGRLYAYTYLPSAPGSGESPRDFYRRALERVRALPGVARVTLANPLPLMPAGSNCATSADGNEARTTTAFIGIDYFDTMGISLVAGRGFAAEDVALPVMPVIINETLARRLWPRAIAIGQPIRIGCDPAESAVVVGVARDTAIRALAEAPSPHIYRPFGGQFGAGLTTLMVHTTPDVAAMVEPVRRTLLALGDGVRVYKVEPLSAHVEQSYAAFRWMVSVLAVFGLLALILAAVGLYGVIGYRVALRTQEIGVRMAIGATRRDIFREVVRYGLVIALIGVAIGEMLTAALTGVAASIVDRIGPSDWTTHAAVAAIWIVVAVIACYVPAARAARVDPMIALRHE